ncbi:endoglucanase [Saonia flava]|uniref:Endoglucanase n=1 Tax=Saonia flava TaxID=523696 RepID=A0A846QUV4_9FLAO|nr:glycoside hydrolase family 9 protein [Saonia flava]NJB70342.1 endoglucanase [Saonia flava]
MQKNIFYASIVLVFLAMSCKEPAPPMTDEFSEEIRLNQIGYYPNAHKIATIVNAEEGIFLVVKDSIDVVFTGALSENKNWELAGEHLRTADFSEIMKEGNYNIYVPGKGYSYPFEIKPNIYKEAFLGSIKGLYYQRAGMALEEKYAGKWHRPAGHPDDSVLYHRSSKISREIVNSPKGWYDAGDYNKYIVNATFPLGQFFLLHQQYPDIVKDGALNIPESNNGVSDYLDELKYEMDWALTMQDDDGGLYHKLTTLNFEGMVMPHLATAQRYIVGKGTAATLDFAGCAAQAYRVFDAIDKAYAHKCLEAAKMAYAWAQDNPNVAFVNPPDVSTGQYGDRDFKDEFFWANAELFISTQDQKYLNNLDDATSFKFRPGDNWTAFMRYTGVFSLLDNKEIIPESLYNNLRTGVLRLADELVARGNNTDYFQPIDDFQWGSNSDVLNAALIMAQGYRLEPKPEYLKGVQQATDYIFGNNANGYSYLTGFGDKTPMFIHHRQSAGDDVEEPVPGLLSGGPNSRLQDASSGTIYPENPSPMKSWVDQEPSYASNEICLNWNSPLTYVLGFLERESN